MLLYTLIVLHDLFDPFQPSNYSQPLRTVYGTMYLHKEQHPR
jgi:hypothetical protein